jgi:hypothetical protein
MEASIWLGIIAAVVIGVPSILALRARSYLRAILWSSAAALVFIGNIGGAIQLFGRDVEWIEWQEGTVGSLLVFLAISSIVYGIKKLLRRSSSAPV